MKMCVRCSQYKINSDFRNNSEMKCGLHSYCRSCDREVKITYKKSIKGKLAEKKYASSEKGKKARKRSYDKARRENPNFKTYFLRSRLKKYYNITVEQFNEMFSNQLECCAICIKHQSEFNRVFAVDHCHVTGKIRGLLCYRCNQGLGNFRDNIALMYKAIEYLKQQGE